MDIYFHGFWRMDWGFGNPNLTAAFIVTLIIGAWGLAWIRSWGFWIALALFTGLGICLIHTFSRGGMVALGAGILPLLWFTPHPWPWKRIVALAASVWVILGISFYLQADSRYMQGITKEDRSITHRLDIWRKTPQMMVNAPGGWGLNQASKAYQEWYQPLDRGEGYLNLINSHLTWLVEIGWGWRFLYLYGWLAALSLCWPGKNARWFSIPLGIWIAFAVACIFSHVAVLPALWIVPGASLLAVLGARIRFRYWPSLPVWLGIAGTSALMLVVVYFVGSSNAELPLRGSASQVAVGNGAPGMWVVINPAVMGDGYGKTIRRYFHDAKTDQSIGIVGKPEDLPDRQDITVVVAGEVQGNELEKLKQHKRLILLNPSFFPQEIDFTKSKSVSVFFGEFSQSPSLQSWQDLGVVKNIEGKGDFLPNWPELIFESVHHS